MFKSLAVIGMCLLNAVTSGPDLCQNNYKIDSLSYIYTTDEWFFTSGGHYWLIRDTEFPPQKPGKPLTGGFLRGDAALFVNTILEKDCVARDSGEQEVHLIELSPDGHNRVIIYDVRTFQWRSDGPIDATKDSTISAAKIDWSQPIDAAFAYKKTNVVIVQKDKYSVVDISGLCDKRTGVAVGYQAYPTTDLSVQNKVDATAEKGDDSSLFVVQLPSYWRLEIKSYSNGRFKTAKGSQLDLKYDFFHQKKGQPCPNTTAPIADGNSNGTTSLPAGERVVDHNDSQMWLIVAIVIMFALMGTTCVVLVLAFSRSRPQNADNLAHSSITGRSTLATGTANKPIVGTSPSSTSVRSNTLTKPQTPNSLPPNNDSKLGFISKTTNVGIGDNNPAVKGNTRSTLASVN